MNRRRFIRSASGLLVPAMLPSAARAGLIGMSGSRLLRQEESSGGGGSGEDLRQNLVLLDDFTSRRINNAGDEYFWDVYNGAEGGPNQTIASFDGSFATNVPSNNVYYVNAVCFGYTQPNHWLRGHIKGGTWDNSINRMSFLFRTTAGWTSGSSSTSFHVGTYCKAVDNFAYGAEDNNRHFYHQPRFNARSNRWAKIVITNKPNHQRGASGSTEHNLISNYFGQLTRVYWEEWEHESDGIARVCELAQIEMYRVDDNDDANIYDMTIQYTGDRYEVGFNSLKNVDQTYDFRYNDEPFDSFSGGSVGDSASNPGSDYTPVFWQSPIMSESTSGLYVAIRRQGATAWSQIYCPYQLHPANTAIPAAKVS